MPITITRFESTPNPNAVKCILNQRIIPPGEAPRSFRDAASASVDGLASAIFALEPAGTITSVLINADWIAVNKSPEADWRLVKKGVERVLSEAH